MNHSREQVQADAIAAALGRCPECHAEIAPADAESHALMHWSNYAKLPPNSDAARRARLVLKLGAQSAKE